MKYKNKAGICILVIIIFIIGILLFFVWDFQHTYNKKTDELNITIEEISRVIRENADGLESLCEYEIQKSQEDSHGNIIHFDEQGEFQDMRNIIFDELHFQNGNIYKNDEYILFSRPYGHRVIILKYKKEIDFENSSSGKKIICDYFTIYSA